MMRRMSVALAALGVAQLCLVGPIAAEQTRGNGAEPLVAPDWRQWLPWESYAGKAQFDERLDRGVKLWGAGMPLGKVFAEVEAQTGVHIGFWPPGDENERVCVNVFLNKEEPPSLRAVMAQASWVTGCAFAYPAAEEGQRTYYLLSTSIGAAAWDRVQEESGRRISGEIADPAIVAVRPKVLARLEEFKKGLILTREQAIEEYRGKDDLMLLALLDPARRALAELVLTMSRSELEAFQARDMVYRRWSEWSPEQRAYLRTCLEGRMWMWASFRRRHGDTESRWMDWDWVEQADPEIGLGAGDSPGFIVRIRYLGKMPGAEGVLDTPMQVVGLMLVPHPPFGGAEEMLELRELLGETVEQEERERAYSAQEAAAEQMQRDVRQAQLGRNLAELGSLSPENEALLSSLKLEFDPGKPYALWQVQEAVAAASGLNVLSDCFWQPARSMKEAMDLLYQEGAPEVTALLALRLTLASMSRAGAIHWMYPSDPWSAAWEWKDAGTFLVFRSVDRGLWREAMLPEEAIQELDGWVEPYLPEEGGGRTVVVPLDPRECSRIVRRLREPHLEWGGRLVYEDPADRANANRQAFREAALGAIAGDQIVHRALGELDDGQWEQLYGVGLRWGVDFSPAPVEAREHRVWWPVRKKGDVLRIGRAVEEGATGRIEVVREGHVIENWNGLPLSVSVWLSGSARPAPGE